jgi:hypothetical protein
VLWGESTSVEFGWCKARSQTIQHKTANVLCESFFSAQNYVDRLPAGLIRNVIADRAIPQFKLNRSPFIYATSTVGESVQKNSFKPLLRPTDLHTAKLVRKKSAQMVRWLSQWVIIICVDRRMTLNVCQIQNRHLFKPEAARCKVQHYTFIIISLTYSVFTLLYLLRKWQTR